MANIQITDQEWKGSLLISCKMDGVSVHFFDEDWTSKDVFELMGRTGGGAMILSALFPPALFVGAAIGALSKFMSKMETGYYDGNKRLVYSGRVYEDDLS